MNDTWEPLSPIHRRILGVLVEKQKTAKNADTYPLTLNSLVTGCNQKNNRDPVTEYSDDDVEETLPGLQAAGLVSKLTGSRVDRWKHLLYEKWNVNATEMAVLAELLLRGPQSVGDLRGRADRMSPIASLDELQNILKPLAERKLIVWLSDPDRRGATLTHGFHTPEELAGARTMSFDSPAPKTAAPSEWESRLQAVIDEVAALRREIESLKAARI